MSSWINNRSKPIKRIFNNISPPQIQPTLQPSIIIPKTPIFDDKEIIFNIINKLNTIKNEISEIPKIAFTFWEGTQFSYLHYLTIKSFALYNPDFRIIIYSTYNTQDINRDWNTNEHSTTINNNLIDINLLLSIKNVEFIKVNLQQYFPELGNISAIYKSDILRIIKLKEHGGIWIDFDILFFKNIPEYIIKLAKNNIGIFMYENQIAVGFIFSHPNNPILNYLIDNIRNNIKYNHLGSYQIFGTIMWTKLLNIPIIKLFITLLSNDLCYSYIWNNLHYLYKSNNDLTTNETIAIHWYNGTSIAKEYINNTDFSNINPSRSIIDRYVYKVINDIETSEFKEKNTISVKDD